MTSTDILDKTASQNKSEPIFTKGSIVIGLLFGIGCWLLDSLFSAPFTVPGVLDSLIPEGQTLVMRFALSIAVAVAAATTSAYLIKELSYRDREEELFVQPESNLLDGIEECAFVVNAVGEILDANAAAATLFSWPVNMFMPMKVEWLVSEFIGDPDDAVDSFSELTEGMSTSSRSVDVVGKALSGRKFVAVLSCRPVRDVDDQYIVVIRQRESDRVTTDEIAPI